MLNWRWPWVARHVYDDMRSDLGKERARNRRLVNTILRLKRQGAVLLPEKTLTMEARRATPFELAVDRNVRARHDAKLRAHLLQYAEDELAKGDKPIEHICDVIENWNAVSHDDEDEDDRIDL